MQFQNHANLATRHFEFNKPMLIFNLTMRKTVTYHLLFISLFTLAQAKAQKTNTSYYLPTQLTNTLPDTCQVQAYVKYIYICPPCPPGMQCKPCIGNHLQVADSAGSKTNYFTLYTNQPEKYKTGKKYRFIIKLHKGKEAKVYEGDLLGTK